MAAGDTTPPTTPGDFRITASTANSVTLAWNPSTDNVGVSAYFLMDNFGFVTYPQRTQTSAQISGLMPGRTYVYTIQALDAARNYSAPSAPVSYTTPPDTTPPSSPVLSLVYVAPARMAVSWTKAVDDTSWIVTHTLLVNGAIRAGDIGSTLLNLTPSTTYTLQVTARDPYGNTSYSNILTVTTPAQTDFTPPSAPANMRGRADFGSCEVYLSWDQSTDNTDPQSRLLYRFYVNGVRSGVSSWVIGVGSNGGRTVLEAPAEGTNSFTVDAVDTSGNASAQSPPFQLNSTDC
jgi:chitodextrinase